MRCLPTIFVALLSALFAAVLANYIGDAATTAHGMSNMEGGRAWFLLFCITASFVAGGVIGAIVTRIRVKSFLPALVIALGVDTAIAAVVAAVAFLTVDS